MSSHQSTIPFEIIHHILIFAVDFRLIKSGFYSQQEQIECVVKFQSLSSALCSSMESHFTSFWLNTLQRKVVNLKFYNEEELEKELISLDSNKLKRIVLLTLFRKNKYKLPATDKIPRITLFGDISTAKSISFLKYITGNLYDKHVRYTMEENLTRQIELGDGEECQLEIHSTYTDGYTPLRRINIINGEAFILIYTQCFKLAHLKRLAVQIESITNRCDIPIVIAIIKIDDTELNSPIMEIEKIIKDFGWLNTRVFETSVVNEENVSKVFEKCIKLSRNGTLKDIRLLKKVISKDVKKKCICM